MAKRSSASSRRGARAAKSGARTSAIDYSDLPPSSEEQLASMRRVGRPRLDRMGKPALISRRLDPTVLCRFKAEAKVMKVGSQTLINEVLAEHAPRRRKTRRRDVLLDTSTPEDRRTHR